MKHVIMQVAVIVLSFCHQQLMPKILRCDLEAIRQVGLNPLYPFLDRKLYCVL